MVLHHTILPSMYFTRQLMRVVLEATENHLHPQWRCETFFKPFFAQFYESLELVGTRACGLDDRMRDEQIMQAISSLAILVHYRR